MSRRHLLLLESTGNQAFIFAANRLRQNVGASELTFQSCGRWALEVTGRLTGQRLWAADTRERARLLLGHDRSRAEVLVATSGKALVAFRHRGDADKVLWEVTHRALRDAPGLTVAGVVVEPEGGRGLHEQVRRAATAEMARVRDGLPAAGARFRRVPIVRDCAISALPAEALVLSDDGRRLLGESPDAAPERTHEALSAVAIAKQGAVADWLARLATETAIGGRDRLPRNQDQLEAMQEEPWIGVVHADGNGVGAIFSDFGVRSRARDDEEYASQLRAFSLGLELVTLAAFDRALSAIPDREKSRPAAVPLILGGDDVTAMVSGASAMRFAHTYVQAWQELSREDVDLVGPVVREIAGGGLTARAGVAIVKPHFPFHAAYDLAEALADAAKVRDRAGRALGAIDFHVLHDSSDAALARIRGERQAGDGGRLWTGPYAVTAGAEPTPAFAELQERVDAMRQEDGEGRRVLSASLLHRLRARLFEGAAVAGAELEMARPAYDAGCLDRLTYAAPGGGRSLVSAGGGEEGTWPWRTAYLDALDLVDLWDGWERP